jgi:hypothetical protein
MGRALRTVPPLALAFIIRGRAAAGPAVGAARRIMFAR